MQSIISLLKHIFSYDFMFYVNPVHLSRVDTLFGLIAGLSIVVSIACKGAMRFSKNDVFTKLVHRYFRLSATVGIVGALWYGLRYQNIDIFGSHFVFILLLVIAAIWKFYIVRYWFAKYRSEKDAWEKEQIKRKYLKTKA